MRFFRFALAPAFVAGAALIYDGAGAQLWLTVLAGAMMVSGALAAGRGRTWGIVACFFPGVAALLAAAVGMAPSWFYWAGAAGVLPFGLLVRAMARRDRAAVALLVSLTFGVAIVALFVWHQIVEWLVARSPHLFRGFNAPLASITLGATAVAVAAYARLGRARNASSPSPDVFGAETKRGERRVVVGLGDQDVLAVGYPERPVAIDLVIEPDGELKAEDERRLG